MQATVTKRALFVAQELKLTKRLREVAERKGNY